MMLKIQLCITVNKLHLKIYSNIKITVVIVLNKSGLPPEKVSESLPCTNLKG